MALPESPIWTLVVSTCLAFTVNADCGKDCALCLFHLGTQTEINTLTCTLECEGRLSTTKSVELCKDILQGRKADMSTGEENASITSAPQEEDRQRLVKKYSSFMKRYGGFMKKAAEVGAGAEEENDGGEIMKRYGGFMKKDAESGGDRLDVLAALLDPKVDSEGSQGGEIMKRYGGFMKKAAEVGTGAEEESDGGEIMKRYGGFMRSIRRILDMDDGAKELQKRYGGFMRRVGRPEWKEEQKRYTGLLQLSQKEDGTNAADMEKRYGGFMD